MFKVYRYRIYPTKRQAKTLSQHLSICAELYNAALQERREAWKLQRKSISWFDQNRQLPDIKQARADVAQVSSLVLENVTQRVDFAFKRFFSRAKQGGAGYPRFRSVQRYDSMTFRQIGNALNGDKLRLPHIGYVKIKLHRSINGEVKTLTVRREAERWFAVFACEVEPQPLPFNPNMIGVDVGLTHFATLRFLPQNRV